jgi:peptide/nickel transport system permease protein
MIRWLAGRLAQALVTLALVTVITFFLMRLAPGDPMAPVGDRQMSQREVLALRAMYGLDQPLYRQFTAYLTGLLHGDLGTSFSQRRPVATVVAERLPATLLLGGCVLVINFTLGVWLGARQAVRRGSRFDHLASTLSLSGYAMPSFWLGMLLIWLFAIHFRVLPASGMRDLFAAELSPARRALDLLRHLTLPVATLSLVTLAITMRHQRSAMLEVLRLDYVRTARAKGLPERVVLRRHAWRNAIFPTVTLLGLWLPVIATGAVFVEAVFSWPGLGSLAQDAIGNRDYPLLMGTSMLTSTTVVVGGLLADVGYLFLDPRLHRR